MKANTAVISSLICAEPPWSVHTGRHPRVSGIILKQQPDSKADKGQQQRLWWSTNSLSLSPVRLRSMWAHLLSNLVLSLSLLCSTFASFWEPPAGESSSRACLVNEERSRDAGLDVYLPWQSWTSDDPSPLLLTLHCAQQPAAVSGPMLVGRPAATQTTTHAKQAQHMLAATRNIWISNQEWWRWKLQRNSWIK